MEPNSSFSTILVIHGKSHGHQAAEAAHPFVLPGEPAWVLQMKSNPVKTECIPNPIHPRDAKTLLAEGKQWF